MPPNHGEYNLRTPLCGESGLLLQVGTGVAPPELATPWVHSGYKPGFRLIWRKHKSCSVLLNVAQVYVLGPRVSLTSEGGG